VLAEFGGNKHDGPKNEIEWEQLLDSEVGIEGEGLKQVLGMRVLVPHSAEDSLPSSLKLTKAYSGILFGPPGTAKTSICKAIAEALGWNFLVIDTGTFLQDGLEDVSGRITYVFERLKALEKCVILFDEVEEFCLDRGDPRIGMESRMLTTALLTKFNDLRRVENSIFFLATNRLNALDKAITRPGRFDLQLFVGTPGLEGRVKRFEDKLRKVEGGNISIGDEGAVREAVRAFRKVLTDRWDEDLQYFNFMESEVLAENCLAEAVGGKLAEDTVTGWIDSQRKLITLREDDSKVEYDIGKGLSRW